MPDPLIDAYTALSDLTRPLCDTCAKAQRCQARCCFNTACVATELWAKSKGVTLERVGDPDGLFFMGPDGCVVSPHLRPHCTSHLCPETEEALDPETRDAIKTLRDRIARMEHDYSSLGLP